MTSQTNLTPAYAAALENARAAYEIFSQAQMAYRAGKMSDDDFLDARAEHELSQIEFDAAYAAEGGE